MTEEHPMTDQHTDTDADRIIQLLPAPNWAVYALTQPDGHHGAHHQRRASVAAWALDGHGTVRALVPDDNGHAVPVRLAPGEVLAHKADHRLIHPHLVLPGPSPYGDPR